MKKQEYIDILYIFLPFELCEKIVSYIYTYKFTNKEELEIAIKGYPNNINIYGDCKYWDVSTITDMSNIFEYTILSYLIFEKSD